MARRGRRRAQHGPDAAGAAFPGTSARVSLVVADLTLARKPAGLADRWGLPSLASGFLLPLSGGRHRVVVVGEEQQRLGRDAPVTATSCSGR
ncbi:hypothetical protein GCM10010464_18270 [Pseudonocardia yunnanensis]